MRLTKVLPILAVVVLVGVVVLIVVEVANYDGRAPTQKFAFNYSRGPILKTCVHFPGDPNGETERGIPGATVPGAPRSALICRWEGGDKGKIQKAEGIVRSEPELAELVRALNSLGVRSEPEGEYAEGEYGGCPELPIQKYGVGLRYPGSGEVQVAIEYSDNGCGYAWNVQDGTTFLPSERLETTLDRLLEPSARERRREVLEELDERDRARMREVGAIAKRCRLTHEHCELP
jgi:hypothetical protein